MKKWEYNCFYEQISRQNLNNLGSEGWELVSHSATSNLGMTSHYYVFKRELKE